MDRTHRQAATVATVVALPLAVLVGFLAFSRLSPDPPAASPSPTPAVQATTPVEMAAPPLTERQQVVCRALLSKLPPAVRDRAQRPVTAGVEQNAAYGDPAITVACGVPMPQIPQTDTVYPLSNVCWHSADLPDATVWTTVDREVPVQVTVPRSYEAPGQWTIAFSKPVLESVLRLTTAPTGCGQPTS